MRPPQFARRAMVHFISDSGLTRARDPEPRHRARRRVGERLQAAAGDDLPDWKLGSSPDYLFRHLETDGVWQLVARTRATSRSWRPVTVSADGPGRCSGTMPSRGWTARCPRRAPDEMKATRIEG